MTGTCSAAVIHRFWRAPPRVVRSRENRLMNKEEFAALATRENYVLSLQELASVGVTPTVISRRVRDKDWGRLLPCVYLVTRGGAAFAQKIAAVTKWRHDRTATFDRETAAYMHRLISEPPAVLTIAVPPESALRSIPDRVNVRRSGIPISSTGSPPRTTIEHTVVDLIHCAQSADDVLGLLIAGVQRRMSITRFTAILGSRKRMRHRASVLRLLEITDLGVESHLEFAYVREVEQAHSLPRSIGQKRELIRGRWIRSDRWLAKWRVRIELDGELAHPGRMTDQDVMRDNDVRIVLNEITLRYRWPQVLNQPCSVAAQVARALRLHGWDGAPTPCGPGCNAADEVSRMESDLV